LAACEAGNRPPRRRPTHSNSGIGRRLCLQQSCWYYQSEYTYTHFVLSSGVWEYFHNETLVACGVCGRVLQRGKEFW
jgi:hypothetical protein